MTHRKNDINAATDLLPVAGTIKGPDDSGGFSGAGVSEIRYRRLFESAKDGILILDAETGMIVDVNPYLIELLGYSHEQFIGKEIWELGLFKDIFANQEKFFEIQQTGYARYDDLPFETVDGRRINVEFVSNGYLENNKKVIQCNIRDITDRKRTEAALIESEGKFRNIFDNSPVAKSITSLDGSVHVNPAFCRMLGYTMEELAQTKWRDISHPDDLEMTLANINKLQSGEKSAARFVKRYLKKDGSVVWADVSTLLQKDHEGKPSYFITVALDISERRLAENERAAALRQSERLASELIRKNTEMEQFLYVTTHDLRSPIVNIHGFSQELSISLTELMELLPSMPADIEKRIAGILRTNIPESIDYIQKSTRKMDALLSGLLQISRMGRAQVQIEPVDMNALLSGTIDLFQHLIQERSITLTVGSLPPCQADNHQLEHICENLLDNAIKYLDPARPGALTITGEKKGDAVVYRFTDNGIGIAPHHHERIFDLFYRLHPDQLTGEGLGLASIRRSLNRIDGRIWVESQEGVGTTFFIQLPGVS